MAMIQLGTAGSLLNSASSVLGTNEFLSNVLGGATPPTPMSFFNKFTSSSIFDRQSLVFTVRGLKAFDVIFQWYPLDSQIRSYFANAFASNDSDMMSYFIQDVSVPGIGISQNKYSIGGNSHFASNVIQNGIEPQGDLTIEFLSTEFSLVEHCFYQWISEVETPFWIYTGDFPKNAQQQYNIQNCHDCRENSGRDYYNYGSYNKMNSGSNCVPFTKADIQIKYYSANLKELHSVWLWGCFPKRIDTENPSHKPVNGIETKKVIFACDSISISSPFIPDSANEAPVSNFVNNFTKRGYWTTGLTDDFVTTLANQTIMKRISEKATKKMKKTNNNSREKELKYQQKFINKVNNKISNKI